MRALIVTQERNHRGALAASRALARAGWLVGCGSNERANLVAASRATRHWHLLPPPTEDLDAFLESVQRAVEQVGYEVILPGGDAETLALSAGRDRIDVRAAYPPHEAVVRAFDKLELAEGAERAGLATPRTVPATDDELARVDRPTVVKARLHWTPGSEEGALRLPTTIASSHQEAARDAAAIRLRGGEPILQEVIPGRIMHCHAVIDRDGEMIACVKQLSEPLTLPPVGGTRVRSRTVPLEEELQRGVRTFLADLGWFGFASLQFIQPDDGDPRVIDFNGRMSLSFEQSIASGPNFPALWAAVATDRPIGEVPAARVGLRYQWLEGDLQRALMERRGGLAADVIDCLRYARGATHGIWRRDDLMPGIRYTQHYLAHATKIGTLMKRKPSPDAGHELG